MQAPLSNTASGKFLDSRPIHAAPNGNMQGVSGGWKKSASTRMLHRSGSLAEGAGLAHDAGNLLGALGLYSQLLARPGVLREEHRHYADEIRMLSGRSRELIDRLLNPATTERRGPQTVAASGEAPGLAIPEVIERCRGLLDTIARRAVAITYEAGAGLPVPVPEEALERILVNLTKNAAEATKGEGAIHLRVTCRAGLGGSQCVVLSVADRGRGMSFATVQRLMQPSGTQRPVGPHGIGFRVVRELVGATGGQLRLESHTEEQGDPAGCGTKVEIAWAVAQGSRQKEAEPMAKPVHAAPDEAPYIPTSFSERHGLLAGHDSAGRRGPRSEGVASFQAAGRMSC